MPSLGGPMVGAPRFDLACFSLSLSRLAFACFLVGWIGLGLVAGEERESVTLAFVGVSLTLLCGGRPMDCGMLASVRFPPTHRV